MFDYWNDELLEALTGNTPNLKRLKRASTEALEELETMRELVADDRAASLEPLIEERAKIDRQLQHGTPSWSQTAAVSRVLEAQTRQIQREFFWREVEDHLKQ
jgi:CHASE3 domain sensor protein